MGSESAKRSTRILVVGGGGLAGVRCYDWRDPNVPNLADFDAVLVSGPSLVPLLVSRYHREMKSGRREGLYEGLSWRTRRVDELLRALLASGGSVYAILPGPEFISLKREPYIHEVDTLPWLPVTVAFHDEKGETLEIQDQAFARYLAEVRSWERSFAPVDYARVEAELSDAVKPEWHVVARAEPIAVNRQGEAVALRLVFDVQPPWVPPPIAKAAALSPRTGQIALLPAPTEVSAQEGLRVLLEDFCGVAARSVPPEWAKTIAMPGDDVRRAAEAEAAKALEDARREQQETLAAQAAADEFKRLLYEKGPPLQEVTRDTFEAMGIGTMDSPVSDEFMVVRDDRKVLVEVTGTGKSIAGRDLSQLIKDLGNYLHDVGQGVKGVLIGNAWIGLPPGQRDTPDKPIFPDDVQKTAKNHSIALVSTLELFTAYCAFLEGKVTPDQVFRRIADGSGVVTLVD
jgi:hypothetical protein